jgi:chromosome segregation ATPase
MEENRLSEDLREELTETDLLIRQAMANANEEQLIKLETRKRVLPVLIAKAEIKEFQVDLEPAERELEEDTRRLRTAQAKREETKAAIVNAKQADNQAERDASMADNAVYHARKKVDRIREKMRECEATFDELVNGPKPKSEEIRRSA